MKAWRGVLVAIMGWCGVMLAADPMAEAQKLFAVGRPAEAAAVLGKVVRAGPVGADVWFNLGQAYSAAGEPGKALWAWRQGVRSAPRDGGLRQMVAQARQRTGGTGVHPLAVWTGWLRLEEWAAGLMLATLALLGWMVAGWTKGRGPLRRWAWFAGAQGVLAAGWLAAWLGLARSPDAVVVTREAAVALAPVAESKVSRTLTEGAEVRVIRRFGDWAEVELDGARAGWIRSDQVWLDPR